MKGQGSPGVTGSLALTIKLGRLAVALFFLLLEEFEASARASQEQPEALAQREGEWFSGQGPPRHRRSQTQEGPDSAWDSPLPLGLHPSHKALSAAIPVLQAGSHLQNFCLCCSPSLEALCILPTKTF